jgi:hypothetical protein
MKRRQLPAAPFWVRFVKPTPFEAGLSGANTHYPLSRNSDRLGRHEGPERGR